GNPAYFEQLHDGQGDDQSRCKTHYCHAENKYSLLRVQGNFIEKFVGKIRVIGIVKSEKNGKDDRRIKPREQPCGKTILVFKFLPVDSAAVFDGQKNGNCANARIDKAEKRV